MASSAGANVSSADSRPILRERDSFFDRPLHTGENEQQEQMEATEIWKKINLSVFSVSSC
jgi:hypothetical protein